MEIQISSLNLLMVVLNVVCSLWMYNKKYYKNAIFNGFVAGACFMAFLNSIK